MYSVTEKYNFKKFRKQKDHSPQSFMGFLSFYTLPSLSPWPNLAPLLQLPTATSTYKCHFQR